MPIVRIDIQSGKTTEYKRALLHGVRDAITASLGVPDDRVVQRIVESPAENLDATEIRSDRLTIIEISMLPRAAELKEQLYRSISDILGADPGISRHDLIVLLNDPPAECFFLNGAMQCTAPASAPTDRSVEEDAE